MLDSDSRCDKIIRRKFEESLYYGSLGQMIYSNMQKPLKINNIQYLFTKFSCEEK